MIKTVDIAHAGQSSSEAIVLLEVAISTAKQEGVVAVKIIHGLGSGSVAAVVAFCGLGFWFFAVLGCDPLDCNFGDQQGW